ERSAKEDRSRHDVEQPGRHHRWRQRGTFHAGEFAPRASDDAAVHGSVHPEDWGSNLDQLKIQNWEIKNEDSEITRAEQPECGDVNRIVSGAGLCLHYSYDSGRLQSFWCGDDLSCGGGSESRSRCGATLSLLRLRPWW